jgi:hypothetical protein
VKGKQFASLLSLKKLNNYWNSPNTILFTFTAKLGWTLSKIIQVFSIYSENVTVKLNSDRNSIATRTPWWYTHLDLRDWSYLPLDKNHLPYNPFLDFCHLSSLHGLLSAFSAFMIFCDFWKSFCICSFFIFLWFCFFTYK